MSTFSFELKPGDTLGEVIQKHRGEVTLQLGVDSNTPLWALVNKFMEKMGMCKEGSCNGNQAARTLKPGKYSSIFNPDGRGSLNYNTGGDEFTPLYSSQSTSTVTSSAPGAVTPPAPPQARPTAPARPTPPVPAATGSGRSTTPRFRDNFNYHTIEDIIDNSKTEEASRDDGAVITKYHDSGNKNVKRVVTTPYGVIEEYIDKNNDENLALFKKIIKHPDGSIEMYFDYDNDNKWEPTSKIIRDQNDKITEYILNNGRWEPRITKNPLGSDNTDTGRSIDQPAPTGTSTSNPAMAASPPPPPRPTAPERTAPPPTARPTPLVPPATALDEGTRPAASPPAATNSDREVPPVPPAKPTAAVSITPDLRLSDLPVKRSDIFHLTGGGSLVVEENPDGNVVRTTMVSPNFTRILENSDNNPRTGIDFLDKEVLVTGVDKEIIKEVGGSITVKNYTDEGIEKTVIEPDGSRKRYIYDQDKWVPAGEQQRQHNPHHQ